MYLCHTFLISWSLMPKAKHSMATSTNLLHHEVDYFVEGWTELNEVRRLQCEAVYIYR